MSGERNSQNQNPEMMNSSIEEKISQIFKRAYETLEERIEEAGELDEDERIDLEFEAEEELNKTLETELEKFGLKVYYVDSMNPIFDYYDLIDEKNGIVYLVDVTRTSLIDVKVTKKALDEYNHEHR